MRIIFYINCIAYENLCVVHKLDTLEDCRTKLFKSFFGNSVLNESSCSYCLPHSVRMFLHITVSVRICIVNNEDYEIQQ